MHRFPPSSPRILSRLSSFFSQIDLASGDLFQVIHTRFSPPSPPPPPRRVVARGAHVHRVRGEFVMHFIASNGCRPVHPAANILFHSIISLTVSSPQSDSSSTLFSLRSTALSLKIGGRGRGRLLSSMRRDDFSLSRLIDDESVSKTDRLLTGRAVRSGLGLLYQCKFHVVRSIVKFKK